MAKKHHNAADPQTVADQEEKAKLGKEQHLKDLKEILDLPAGVRYFRKIMEDGKMFSTSFTGNSTTFFNEGMRNLVLRIFGDVCEAAPEKIQQLIVKENDDA